MVSPGGGWRCRLFGHQFGPLRPRHAEHDLVSCCRDDCRVTEVVRPDGAVLWAESWEAAWAVAMDAEQAKRARGPLAERARA